MNAIELLRRAILAGRWAGVREAFRLLTGESLPEPADPRADALRAIRAAADAALGGAEPADVPAGPAPDPDPDPDPAPAPPPRPGRAKEGDWNRFKDDLTRARKDIAESRRLSSAFEGKDYRPAFARVRAVCAACSKEYMVHPDLAPRKLAPDDDQPTRFYCDRCGPRKPE